MVSTMCDRQHVNCLASWWLTPLTHINMECRGTPSNDKLGDMHKSTILLGITFIHANSSMAIAWLWHLRQCLDTFICLIDLQVGLIIDRLFAVELNSSVGNHAIFSHPTREVHDIRIMRVMAYHCTYLLLPEVVIISGRLQFSPLVTVQLSKMLFLPSLLGTV